MDIHAQILQFVISGIMVGSIYALIALGFNIVFNATDAINFAQGEFVVLGGMMTITFYHGAKLPLIIAFFLSVLSVTLIAMFVERFTIHYQRGRSIVTLIILTIGVSICLRGGAMFIWGKDSYSLPAFSGSEPIIIMDAAILPQAIWIIVIGIVVAAGVHFFFKLTLTGKAMKACSYDRMSARLVGIDDNRMVLWSFALAATSGSIAGVIITPITFMAYDQGLMLGLKGFCAVLLGGLGSMPGSIIGGLLLGIFESLGAGLISSGYKDAIAFLILLMVLFIKPSGIFGKKIEEKV